MQRILIVFIILVVSGGFALSQIHRLGVDTSLDDWLAGANGFQKALQTQLQSGKPIAVFFYTDWCSSCKELKSNVLGTDDISHYLDQFIKVKINPENSSAARRIADRFGVAGYPTFLIKKFGVQTSIPVAVNRHTGPTRFKQYCDAALRAISP